MCSKTLVPISNRMGKELETNTLDRFSINRFLSSRLSKLRSVESKWALFKLEQRK
jgi:hypothetical protein